MLVVTAFALGFVSLLIYIRLASQGMSPKRIVRIIAEMWGIFALIITIFTLISRRIGAASSASIVQEIARIRTLPAAELAMLALALLLAVGLFVHLLWSMHRVQRSIDQFSVSSDGGSR